MSQDSPIPRSTPRQAGVEPLRMTRRQKIITSALWGVLLLVIAAVLALKFIPHHVEMPVLFHGPHFALTDQSGSAFSADDLKGKAYICDFIFTTCGAACPLMSQKLAGVQNQTPTALHLVSFTVNPEHDSPAVLKEYSARYGADLNRWHFLTSTPGEMSAVAVGMKIQKPDEANPTVMHSEKFFLVDGDGNIRGIYNSEDPESMKALVADASWLAQTRKARGQ